MFVPDCLRIDSAIAGLAVAQRRGLGVFLAVVDVGDVADADRVAADAAHDDVADLPARTARPLDAQREFCGPVSRRRPGR